MTLPTEENDMNKAYDDAISDIKIPSEAEKKHIDAKTQQEDDYKSFRTRFVLFWMISNLVLVVIITNSEILLALGDFENRSNGYFAFILWSVAGLAAFRFVGSCIYLVFRTFERLPY